MVFPMNSYKVPLAHHLEGLLKGRRRGFTYLWTLLVIAFMGIGLVIASEVYSTALQREREQELIFIGREFRQAIGRYYESNMAGGQKQYPLTLDDLLKDPRFPNGRRYLRRIYIDPMTGKNQWGTILVRGRVAGVYSLSEKVPIKQDHFEGSESGFRGKEKYSEWKFTYPADLVLSPPLGTGHDGEISMPASRAVGSKL